VWNNLRARHYSVLILLAIVALETSAIAIDRFINREGDTAFAIESPFQNNNFIQSFKVAEASCKKVPAALNSTKPSTQVEVAKAAPVKPQIVKVEKSVKADFIAAASKKSASDKVYVEYSIQPGDSLSHIAKLFGSDTNLIKNANKLEDKHTIMAGQTIKVPLPAKDMTYTVKRGDSLSKIANRFRVPLQSLIAHNSLKSHRLQADQKLRIPVKNNPNELKLISNRETIKKAKQRLAIVKESKPAMVASKPRLEPVKLSKIQIAQAPASKPDIKFIEKELLKTPPTVKTAKAEVKKADDAVAVKIEKVTEKPEAKAVVAKAAPVASKKAEKKEEEKAEKLVYTVKKGDNLLKISHRYNTTVAQIKTENGLDSNLLKIGDKLKLSPGKKLYRVVKTPAKKVAKKETTIVAHRVKKGECLSLIARKYRTTIGAIVSENNLNSTIVKVGQKLKVPADKKKYKVTNKSSVRRKLMKMPVRGRLSDRYGWRNHPVYRKRLFHAGIDVAAPKGTPIVAAMSGKVIYSGRRSGYGKIVILSHSSGYSTRYGHCSSLLVKKGQYVKAGQTIARVGATGVATGNHLHFEVRKNGKTVNPLTYLK
jgi:murein DD-endopeptidase MepM/ murein hydrolase activator NlpD